MKLLNYYQYQDYGTEYYFQFISVYPKFALIDGIVQWDEFPATELFPMMILSIGSRSIIGFSFRWKWFQIRCDFVTFSPRNFSRYQGESYK